LNHSIKVRIMSLAVSASRFACLPDDDAADWKGPKKQSNKKKDESKKPTDNKPKDASKAKALKEAKELQNIAFGGQKKKKKKGGAQAPQSQQRATVSPSPVKETSPEEEVSNKVENGTTESVSKEQKEEWEEKDKAAAEKQFSQAMQEAIMLSKLEAEKAASLASAQERLLAEGKLTPELLAALSKEERKRVVQGQKSKNKMSLDQFISQPEAVGGQAGQPLPVAEPPAPQIYKHPRHKDRIKEKEGEHQQDFFTQSDAAVARAIDKEQRMENLTRPVEREQGTESGQGEPQEDVVKQYRQLLVSKELELEASRREASELSSKLADCKLRTKKLSEILMAGEMKEKTEVIVQLHRMEQVRDDLTASLSLTTGQLESERSLVSSIEGELRRVTTGGEAQQGRDLANRILALIMKARK